MMDRELDDNLSDTFVAFVIQSIVEQYIIEAVSKGLQIITNKASSLIQRVMNFVFKTLAHYLYLTMCFIMRQQHFRFSLPKGDRGRKCQVSRICWIPEQYDLYFSATYLH